MTTAPIEIGVNLEYVRHADRSFAYGVRRAAELGFRFVEPCLMQGHCTLTEAGFCPWQSVDSVDPRSMRATLEEYGLRPSAVSAHAQIMQPWAAEHLIKAVCYAATLGAPIVNTAEGKKPDWLSEAEALTMIGVTLRAVLHVAEQEGVKVALEPHGQFTTTVSGMQRLLDLDSSPVLGVNFDPGNVFLAGAEPVALLDALAPHVIHVHAKDIGGALLAQRGTVTGTPVGVACGEGVIDWVAILMRLYRAGFHGVLSVECGTEEQAARSLAYLRPLLEVEEKARPSHGPQPQA
ncbi:MAG: sugar phosphate isomerase/epimerase [Chloroflexi bacterium]|nr:sugar phosphate isomerase/epimerase [Chloroflexota bacterium]